jgi:hypothetical protein
MKKIIILLFITAFLLSVLSAYSQGPAPRPLILSQTKQNQAEPKHTKSGEQQLGSDELPLAVKIIKAKEPNHKENDNTKNTNENATTNWLLVLFNGLLAIFTLGLYITSHRMWKSTKSAADAAKKSADSLQAIERAYLFIDYMKWNHWKQPFTIAEYNQSSVEMGISNTGRTPAINYEIGIKVAIKTGGYPTKEDARKVTKISLPMTIVIKSQEVEPFSCFERIGPSVITETDFSKCAIICYGFIRYDDIFFKDKHHEMLFCYEFKPSQSHESFRVSLDTELNCYT